MCFLAPAVCKQASVPQPHTEAAKLFCILVLARQQLGKSYKLFIRWLLADTLDAKELQRVCSPRHLCAENS